MRIRIVRIGPSDSCENLRRVSRLGLTEAKLPKDARNERSDRGINSPSKIDANARPLGMDPRVYRALAAPIVGHVDPWFTEMMGIVQHLLRQAFQTENRITFPISGSGSAGIEAAVQNSLEPGDECIVCVNGAFSERMAIMAEASGRK